MNYLAKIAIDARKLARSGVGIYIKNLINALIEFDRENEYRLIVNRDSEVNLLEELPNNFRVVNVKTKIFSILEHLELPMLFWREKIDLFHSTHFFLPFRKTCKCVVTIHDLMPLIFPAKYSPLKRHYLCNMISRAICNADAIIAVSWHTREDILNRFTACQPRNIHVIYEAPDEKLTSEKSAEILDEVGLSAGGYLLYVGSDKFNKNLPGLLAAYRQIDQMIKYPLVLAGKISARIADQSGVKLLGVVSDNVLDCLYKNARVFVMPSFYEGFGLPILEAMARGAPVVTSNVASLAEIAGEAAWLLDPHDTKAIADAIAEAAGNGHKRDELIKRGLAQAQKFSWATAVKETIKVYDEVLKRC